MRFKAFLLSAFIFPGLGQLYHQERKKGVILVLLANLLVALVLLVGVMLFSQEYVAVYYPRPLTGEMVRAILSDLVSRPLFLAPFCLLIAVWAYAAVDAARGGAPSPPSPEAS
jgi:Na+-driven multidrug efflux pump